VAVFYHSWWPGTHDPFYLHNTVDNMGRINDYGISTVPELRLDGATEPVFFYTYERIAAAYAERKAAPTGVTLDLAGSFDRGSGELALTVTAVAAAPLPPGDYRLHMVLAENGIVFDAPNGIDVHEHTMRRMSPDFSGHSVAFGDVYPASVQASDQFVLDPGYSAEHCEIVAFLQEAGTREVQQAAAVAVSELPEPTATARASWSAVKSAY
jgi:hypothetical protein